MQMQASNNILENTSEDVCKLADFVEKHRHRFPLRIKVIEGFCGKEER